MPRPRSTASKPPSYCLHKASGQAVVRIDGRDYYLGKHGSHESRQEYDNLIGKWLLSRNNGQAETPEPVRRLDDPSVAEVIEQFWRHAKGHYVKRGRPTSELRSYKRVFRLLKRLYGFRDASEFSPECLRACQRAMVEAGLCRKTVNDDVGRIRRVFKWAVSWQMVSPSVLEALRAVDGLQKGRTKAKESEPVPPVPWEHVEPVLAHVSPEIDSIIRLLWHTGARPGEILEMRTGDIDRSGDVWVYVPREHKTEHRGRQRRVYLGPKAQLILKRWLRADPDRYLFSPLEAERRRLGYRPRRRMGDRYTYRALWGAIQRAVKRINAERQAKRDAGESNVKDMPEWAPNQLRHAKATEVRKQHGLEGTQVVLGHAHARISEIYAERDFELARRIALETG